MKIDAKGRVSVPSGFRSVAQRRGYQDYYALRSLRWPAMDVGGADLLDRYEQRIAQEDPFEQAADDMSLFCHGDGVFLKVDAEGRIAMSDFLREHTGIRDEAVFVGRGHFFQLWEPATFQSKREEARARLLGQGAPGNSNGGIPG